MTTSVLSGSAATRVLQPGEILTVTADAVSSGRVGRLGNLPGDNVPDVPATFTALAASKTLTFGPFPTVTRHLIEALSGQGVGFTQAAADAARMEIVGDASDLRFIAAAGAPTDSTTGANVAGIGSRYTDTATGRQYANEGTKASPVWRAMPTVIGAIGDMYFIVGAGAPTDATTGANVAGIGSQYTDVTNANLYINGGTKASPVWKLVTRAA
jgi:hypothetical protein